MANLVISGTFKNLHGALSTHEMAKMLEGLTHGHLSCSLFRAVDT